MAKTETRKVNVQEMITLRNTPEEWDKLSSGDQASIERFLENDRKARVAELTRALEIPELQVRVVQAQANRMEAEYKIMQLGVMMANFRQQQAMAEAAHNQPNPEVPPAPNNVEGEMTSEAQTGETVAEANNAEYRES